jgi:hypothetical protein
MSESQARRCFLNSSLATSAAFGLPLVLPSRGANERLNIGVGGRSATDMAAVAGENVVAWCDVDVGRLNTAAAKFSQAKTYFDYRELLDRKDLNAVVIATPDHALRQVRRLQRARILFAKVTRPPKLSCWAMSPIE